MANHMSEVAKMLGVEGGVNVDSKFSQQETAICKYVCDKYYAIQYNHDGYKSTVKGLLLNYYSGNVVLLSEDGIYHLKYQDIVFMKPVNTLSLDKFSQEYKELLKILQVDEV